MQHRVAEGAVAGRRGGTYNETMLTDKIAVVTGASSGIGLAIAKRFVADGAHVFITGRNPDALAKASAELGAGVTAVQGDAGNLADLDRLVATVRAAKGRVDVIVANAGVNDQLPIAEATPEHFDRVFGTNVRAVFFTVQKLLPLVADGGSVVLVASAVHGKGLPTLSAYSASKAAVRSFARSWAAELKGRRIRVNSLSPGAVETPLLYAGAEDRAAVRELYSSWIPMGRIGRPEEIAAAAAFLASAESSYSTGMDLVADGGFTQL